MEKDDSSLNNATDNDQEISEEQIAYIKKMLERLMELGIGVVYGDEEEGNEVAIDHRGRLPLCRALCYSFIFALTKEEVQRGHIKWNPERPYFIARDEDGFCLHLDRKTLMCGIWEERPRRCRQYDCRQDTNVWIDWQNKVMNPNAFDHLRKLSAKQKHPPAERNRKTDHIF
jgi:Fe-S-cluster containining protein